MDLYRAHFDAICHALAKSLAEIVGKNFTVNQSGNFKELFTFQALVERLQLFFMETQFVESVLQEGINQSIFQTVWYELWRKNQLSFEDFCGLCALIYCTKKGAIS